MATISACAVGSLAAVTRLDPAAITAPSFTTSAANGPPPQRTFSAARSIACLKSAGFITGDVPALFRSESGRDHRAVLHHQRRERTSAAAHVFRRSFDRLSQECRVHNWGRTRPFQATGLQPRVRATALRDGPILG